MFYSGCVLLLSRVRPVPADEMFQRERLWLCPGPTHADLSLAAQEPGPPQNNGIESHFLSFSGDCNLVFTPLNMFGD